MLTIGAIGVFIPLLPTTPFVLVATACLSSSPKIKNKIMKIKFFKEHVENYEKREGLSLRTLIKSLVYLWVMLLISMFVISKPIWFAILSIIGAIVTVHLLVMAKKKSVV